MTTPDTTRKIETPATTGNPAPQQQVIGGNFGLTATPGRKVDRDAEAAGGPGGEGEGSVVSLGDAVNDCQAEADAWVVSA